MLTTKKYITTTCVWTVAVAPQGADLVDGLRSLVPVQILRPKRSNHGVHLRHRKPSRGVGTKRKGNRHKVGVSELRGGGRKQRAEDFKWWLYNMASFRVRASSFTEAVDQNSSFVFPYRYARQRWVSEGDWQTFVQTVNISSMQMRILIVSLLVRSKK